MGAAADVGEPGYVLVGRGLLDEEDVVAVELLDGLDGGADGPATVGVDAEAHVGADGCADGGDSGYVFGGVKADFDFHGVEALVDGPGGDAGGLFGGQAGD